MGRGAPAAPGRRGLAPAVAASILAFCAVEASAQIAFVKSVGTAGDTVSGTSLSLTVPVAGVAVDNTLFVVFAMDPATGTITCGDSRGNVYAKDADIANGSGTSGVRTVVCSAPVTTPLVAGDTITVYHPTAAARGMTVQEFSGVGAVDRSATATATGTAVATGFTANTSQADEILIGAIGVETDSNEAFTAGSGYTALTPGSSGAAVGPTSNVTVDPEYRIVTARGSYTATGTLGVSRLWSAALVTYRAKCGNGTVDAGEQCDKGAAANACCASTCQFVMAGTTCRAAADTCDAAETCSGAGGGCPSDGFLAAGTSCRAATDACDAAETCTGSGVACPADGVLPAGTVCRPVADVCDAVETCTGSGATCPADGAHADGTVCRAAAGTCDLAEVCPGGSVSCPADVQDPGCTGPPPGIALVKHVGSTGTTTSGTWLTVTVPAGGVAANNTLIVTFATDPSNLTGTVSCGDTKGNTYSKDADVLNGSASTTGVRTVVFAAPIATPLVAGDTITVTHPTAAARAVTISEFSGLSGVEDRTAVAVGTSTTPSSGFTAATSQAEELLLGAVGVETNADEAFVAAAGYIPLTRASSGSGSTPASHVTVHPEFHIVSAMSSYAAGGTINPARLWSTALVTYRARCGNGTVEPTEQCDKAAASSVCCTTTCQFQAVGTMCRAASGACDAAESCTGASGSCPADGFQPGGTVCRPAIDACDAAEACGGTSATCPVDGLIAAGTICRPAVDSCDSPEACTGASSACPTNGVHAAGAVCRGVADGCDVAEVCGGGSASCPADVTNPGCAAPPLISFVKTVGTGGSTAASNETAVAVPAAGVAAGNTVLVAFAMDPASGTVTCGDTQNNVYARDADVVTGTTTTGVRTVICSALITTPLATGDVITVTHPVAAARATTVSEFGGVAALDRTSTAAGNNGTPTSGFTLGTRQADELVIGAIGVETFAADPFATGPAYTPLPPASASSTGVPTANVTVNAEFRIVTTIGAYSAGGLLNPARSWAAAIATYRARCGNALVETGEPCDNGATNSACCSATCQLATPGTVCRAAADLCDAAEACTGSTASCPVDALQPNTTVCRAAAGVCDAAEACTGTATFCPADGVQPAGTVCRAAADLCDAAETCAGMGTTCPADGLQPAGTSCRPAGGPCDATEVCAGTSASCPTDGFAPAGTVCRTAAGACDVVDVCAGSSGTCPPDGKSQAVCRPVAGSCDVEERCDGAADVCPADGYADATRVCRPSTSPCDQAESCSGTSAVCPADSGPPDDDDDGVCNTIDVCPIEPDTDQADSDKDGVGDVCDPCTNVEDVFATQAQIKISRLTTPGGDDTLTFRGAIVVPTSPPIDPMANGVRVLVADAKGSSLLDATLPGGTDQSSGGGWKVARGGTSWVYTNPTGFVTGVGFLGLTKIQIKSSRAQPGRLAFQVAGRNGSYPASLELPLAGTLVIDPPLATSGQCGEAVFAGASPRCVFNPSRSALRCR